MCVCICGYYRIDNIGLQKDKNPKGLHIGASDRMTHGRSENTSVFDRINISVYISEFISIKIAATV